MLINDKVAQWAKDGAKLGDCGCMLIQLKTLFIGLISPIRRQSFIAIICSRRAY